MWVFGYGSLMWDNWQALHGGANGVLAELKGYERSFNKASQVNWGTNTAPGPTLNLVEKVFTSLRGEKCHQRKNSR
jgi:cation transport regulator ChaC